MRNIGVAAVQFDVGVAGPTFSVSPKRGVIPAGETQVVAVRFASQEAGPHSGKLRICYNGSPAAITEVELRGLCSVPQVAFEGGPTTFLRSACVGTASDTELPLWNMSRVPVAYEIQVPDSLRDILRFEPARGVLRGGEKLPVTCRFAPRKVRRYTMAIPCRVAPVADVESPAGGALSTTGSSSVEDVCVLNLAGEGVEGGIQLSSSRLDLGVVQVGAEAAAQLTLRNRSGGVLSFNLEVLEVGDDGDPIGPARCARASASPVTYECSLPCPYTAAARALALVRAGTSRSSPKARASLRPTWTRRSASCIAPSPGTTRCPTPCAATPDRD